MQNWSDDMKGAMLMMASMAAFTLNDACMKAVTADLPLFQAIFLRGILTSVALAAAGWWIGGLSLRFSRPDRRVIAARMVGEVASTFTFLLALKHMPLANLSAIMQSLPLLVTLGAALFFGERIGWRRLSAIFVGFAGVLLIIRPGAEGFDRFAVLGLVAAFFVVLRDLATRRLSDDVPSTSVAFMAAISVAVSAAFMLPFSRWTAPSATNLVLIATSATCLIAGYLTSVMSMRVGAIAVVAPFRYTSLVFALVLGLVIFGQFPDAMTLTGAGVVIATGLYTFHRERLRSLQRPATNG